MKYTPPWAAGACGASSVADLRVAPSSTDFSRHLYTGVDVRSRVSVTIFRSFVHRPPHANPVRINKNPGTRFVGDLRQIFTGSLGWSRRNHDDSSLRPVHLQTAATSQTLCSKYALFLIRVTCSAASMHLFILIDETARKVRCESRRCAFCLSSRGV